MNKFRLPLTVIPNRYEIRLEPDLQRGTFTGRETIYLTILESTSEILLNAVELQIHTATVEQPGQPTHEGHITLEDLSERAHIQFPVSLQPGTHQLHLTFEGILNDKLRGFYKSTYKDQDGNTCTLAATQFEATDARRAFPCWDEPAFKSVFSSTLVLEKTLTALSNTPIQSERVEDGKKVVTFYDTMAMSTYLVAYVIGDLEGSPATMVGETPVRIWAVSGKQHLTQYGQDIAAFSLKFFEEYYAQPYPGDKLDLIAIPDFASGAMENFGAITFRETALLLDPLTATHAEQERVADVVAHENAHMWFGDLVTMDWWNGLWLNEAFATFMEMLAVDAWKPEWGRWNSFGVSRAAALSVDGLQNTRPIEFPVEAPQDADAMFDVLTYEKGASVLRMLEQYMGPNLFQKGVQEYLRAHAYRNVDTNALWDALGQASNQPIPQLMNEWIFGEGYPLITVERNQETLTLRQERFLYLGNNKSTSSKSQWHIPIHLKFLSNSKSSSTQLLLTSSETTVHLPSPDMSVVINAGGHGFYRVNYSQDLLKPLVNNHFSRLSSIERFNIVNDAWAATLAGHMPLEEYLGYTQQFSKELDKNVWAVLINSFHTINRIVEASDRSTLESFIQKRVQPLVEELGWSPQSSDSQQTRQLRGEILRVLGTVGNDNAAQTKAQDLFVNATQAATSVDPNILPALVFTMAFIGDDQCYKDFTNKIAQASTPQEERRYIYALTGFRDPSLLDRTLEKTLNGDIRTQDAPFVVSAILMNVYGRDQAWTFVKNNWDKMDQLFPKQGLRRMCGGIVGLAHPDLEKDVKLFFEQKNIDLGGKTLAQYLEQLNIAVAFQQRNQSTLRQQLQQFL